MTLNRRFFLKSASYAAAGSLVWSLSGCGTKEGSGEGSDSTALSAGNELVPSIPDFGLQLYSVRDVIGDDPKGVLKQIADLGYKKIESYQGDQGIFWGMSPTAFKAYIEELGMTIVSTHADTTKDLEKTAAQAAEAGLSYVLQPYIGPQKSVDEWKKRCDEFNKRGEVCKKAGVKFGYHNHDYSFKPIDGLIPQEIMLDNTDPSLVVFELDLMWIQVPEVDAAAHLKKYAGRYELCHIKDFVREPEVASTDLGLGLSDYPSLLKVASESRVSQFIVEQENYPSPVMECIANDAAYMKQLVFKA